MRPISEIVSGIRDTIREAEKAFNNFMDASSSGQSDYREEQEGIANYYLDLAFLELRLFLEANGALQMLQALTADHQEASKNLMKLEMGSWGEPYSFWAGRLRQYVTAVDTTFGTAAPSTVTKQLVDILRATVYSITDTTCFASPPRDESEVHARIEAVLRCIFLDLRHKPPIGKAIKSFEPDTGLPSLRTLIEYKFIATKGDVKRVADEVLADTRGYVSKEWDNFVYVIYETRRLQPEVQWKELLSASGVSEHTQVLVISGEEPQGRQEIAVRRKITPPKTRGGL
jgi:REase_DpnII-MboI